MKTSPGSLTTLNTLFLSAVDRLRKPGAFLTKRGGSYQPVSSEEALRKVAALARGFEKRGLTRGDRLAILAENRLEWALTDYAAMGLGAVSVPIYPTFLDLDLEYILRDSSAKGIVVSTAEQLRKIRDIHSRLSGLRFVLFMDEVTDATSRESGVEGWWDVVGCEDQPGAAESFRVHSAEAQAGDIATILYTSGTTGNPKGVVLTHANITSNIQATIDLFPMSPHDVGMSFLPLSHIFERMLDFTYFHQGVSIAYAESFEALPQNLLEVRPTVMAVVPRVLERVYEKVQETVRQGSPGRQKLFGWAMRAGYAAVPYRLENRALPLGLTLQEGLADRLVFTKIRERLGGRVAVIFSGSAPLSADVARFFWAVGLKVYEGYGLTETSPVIAVNQPGRTRLGTVGPVISGVEVRLGDDFSNDEGRVGREILVNGPNVSPGYYNLDEENRQAFTDGWFHTGDLGSIDADGFLAITGRKKHLFKTSGGKYVPPEKLENLFQGHPCVAQVLVIGDRRKFVSALIVPNFQRLETYAREHGIGFSSREELVRHHQIQAFMERQVETLMALLPPHERVRQIALLPREFTVASGELSATQKIRRSVVEERYRGLIEELYQRRVPHAQTVGR
ncbi:MAG TPA: long-chain fatty acid--CoA ligase [Terriglobia bacterium]